MSTTGNATTRERMNATTSERYVRTIDVHYVCFKCWQEINLNRFCRIT